MNSLKNKVNLIGNLGFNPEVKMIDGGKKLAKVTIATNETYRNAKGERVTDTQWHNLVAFGKTAEVLERYTKVGSKIAVEGKLVSRSYTDKNGQKKYMTEVQVNEVLILSNWNDDQAES
ncbi:MAG: single-stranded DNA-binding protein [Bacteroidia bacterium]|nr:single-stranded DNA-binding protein [Bacteroidia bacterium]